MAAKKAKVKTAAGKAKVKTVMDEFKKGTLRSSSGEKVTDRKQAIAIALSEGRKHDKPGKAEEGTVIFPAQFPVAPALADLPETAARLLEQGFAELSPVD